MEFGIEKPSSTGTEEGRRNDAEGRGALRDEYTCTIESARARYGLSAMLPNLLESIFEWAQTSGRMVNPVAAIQGRLDKLRRLGARRVGVFGSFARGEARADSDVDVYVEFEGDKRVLWTFFDHQTMATVSSVQLLDVPGDATKGEVWH